MILLIGNEKGGVGKSTLAINIAVWAASNGRDTIIVDTDRQCTSTNFINNRRKNANESLPTIHCIQKTDDVYDTLKDISSRYEEVIVDAGGQDSIALRSAMMAANTLIIPLRASQIDLWAIDRMDKLIKLAKATNRELKVKSVIMMTPTNPSIKELDNAKGLLMEYSDLNLLSQSVFDRKIYRDGIIEGKGVIEMSNLKAKKEIINLCKVIYNE